MNTLNNLNKGEVSRIISIDNILNIKKRLLELGLTNGVLIECILINPFKNMKAYRVKNTIIALRNDDSTFIRIGEVYE